MHIKDVEGWALIYINGVGLLKSTMPRSIRSLHPRRVRVCSFLLEAHVCVQSPALFWLSHPPPGSLSSAKLAKQYTEMQSKYPKRVQADLWTFLLRVLIFSITAGSVIRFVPAWWIMDVSLATELHCVPVWPECFLEDSINDVFMHEGFYFVSLMPIKASRQAQPVCDTHTLFSLWLVGLLTFVVNTSSITIKTLLWNACFACACLKGLFPLGPFCASGLRESQLFRNCSLGYTTCFLSGLALSFLRCE